jgi:O-acetyl-ADP-ribose deacetylase (regulator of RNase III)
MKHTEGDLLALARAGEFDIIVHGCNCFCTMGSGIARQIREEYPEAYAADCNTRSGDMEKLGTYTSVTSKFGANLGAGFTIVNAYTQYDYNRPSNNLDVFEYASFEVILRKLAHRWPYRRYGFPYIGMGLARGNPQRIMGMLEWFSDQIDSNGGTVTLVKFVDSLEK